MPYEATPSQVKRGEEIRELEIEGDFEKANAKRLVGGVATQGLVEDAQEAADQANREAHPSEVKNRKDEGHAVALPDREGFTGTEESTTGQRASKRTSSAK